MSPKFGLDGSKNRQRTLASGKDRWNSMSATDLKNIRGVLFCSDQESPFNFGNEVSVG